MNALGHHLLVELYGCDSDRLNDVVYVRQTMLQAAQKICATIIEVVERQFEPQGVTVIIAIAESHLSVHTWPEHRYAAVDVFSCTRDALPSTLVDFFVHEFDAGHASSIEVKRGVIAGQMAATTGALAR